ncbi:MAG: DUF4430 domain-containing protein [Clostridiales bacterium]|nr:DUF4430 domain-containing protein [Clostridiales bacterium]
MRFSRNKITIFIVIIAALAVAWFYGGNYNPSSGNAAQVIASPGEAQNSQGAGSQGTGNQGTGSQGTGSQDAGSQGTGSQGTGSQDAGSQGTGSQGIGIQGTGSQDAGSQAPGNQASGSGAVGDVVLSNQALGNQDTDSETPSQPTDAPALDRYKTEPIPEGKPAPVEPQDATLGDDAFTVTLAVRCDTILDNMNLLNKEKHELVPADGVILPETFVTAYEGESVFNIFQREMKRAGIHMEFRNTPIYNSAYIMDVNNLYEFDVGELSGWMYKVNGWFPNYGCSRYQLQPGDEIIFVYTCDLGRDVGGDWLAGRQIDD